LSSVNRPISDMRYALADACDHKQQLVEPTLGMILHCGCLDP